MINFPVFVPKIRRNRMGENGKEKRIILEEIIWELVNGEEVIGKKVFGLVNEEVVIGKKVFGNW